MESRSQDMVKEFHGEFDILINDEPTIIDGRTANLRIELIKEELEELEIAIDDNDIVEIADALADLKYVVEGTSISYGINLNAVFKEVHRSNMTKVGGYKRGDGKWIKPDTYSPADIKSILFGEKNG